jgi:transposase-like protein
VAMLRAMKRKRRNRAFWQEVIATIERGDASVDQIAHRYGVRKTTLRWWMSQLRRKGSRVELVPVQVADVARSAVRIVSGEIAIELDGGVSLEDVASLVRALRA